jgi:DNA-binding beta-propeller fold protein YncE
MVASGELSGQLLVFSLADPAHPRLLTSVNVGSQAFDPMFAPDGRTVWVPVKGANQVAVVDAGEWRVMSRISTSDLLQPHALTFSPDGKRVFVTNNNSAAHMLPHEPGTVAPPAPGGLTETDAMASVVVIDAATGLVEAVLPLGANLTGMGSRPSG